MKIGIGSFAFRWAIGTDQNHTLLPPFTIRDFLKKSADLQVETIQICDNLPLAHLSEEDLHTVRRDAERLGIEIEVGTKGYQLPHLLNYLAITSSLGAKILRVVLSDHNSSPSFSDALDILRSILPELQKRNIKLAIENHFDLTPGDLARLIQTINHPNIGICLDPLNSITKLVGPEETINTLIPFTLTAHVKDVLVHRQQTGFYIEGCPIGKGLLNLDHFISKIQAHSPSPNLFVECWMDRLADPDATIKQEEEWIQQSLTTLNHLAKVEKRKEFKP